MQTTRKAHTEHDLVHEQHRIDNHFDYQPHFPRYLHTTDFPTFVETLSVSGQSHHGVLKRRGVSKHRGVFKYCRVFKHCGVFKHDGVSKQCGVSSPPRHTSPQPSPQSIIANVKISRYRVKTPWCNAAVRRPRAPIATPAVRFPPSARDAGRMTAHASMASHSCDAHIVSHFQRPLLSLLLVSVSVLHRSHLSTEMFCLTSG